MSLNKSRPHVLVLPEDHANEQLANGFVDAEAVNYRMIQILPVAKGWRKVLTKFTSNYLSYLRRYSNGFMILLIDFDQRSDRLDYMQREIPEDLQARVFVLGVFSDPEDLRRKTQKSFETIGEALAEDCANDTNELWGHRLLRHNSGELERLAVTVKPFLFNTKL